MRVELPCGTHRFRCGVYGRTQPNRNDINGIILFWQDFRRYAVSPGSHQPTSYIEKEPQSNDLSITWAARVRPVALDYRTSLAAF